MSGAQKINFKKDSGLYLRGAIGIVFFVALALQSIAGTFIWEKTHSAEPALLLNRGADLAMEIGGYYFGANDENIYDLEKAEKYYSVAARRDPQIPKVYYHLSRISFVFGRHEESLEYVNKQLEFQGDSWPNAYYVRGLILTNLRRLDEAEEDFKKSLSLIRGEGSGRWAVYNDLAWVYFLKEEFVKTEETAREGLNEYPSNPWLLNSLGVALLNQKRQNEAGEILEQARESAGKLTDDDFYRAYPGNGRDYATKVLVKFREMIDFNLALARDVKSSFPKDFPSGFAFFSSAGPAGGIIIAACAGSCVPNEGDSCTGACNSCGGCSSGTIECDGSCNAGGAPPNPACYGQTCSDTACNSCGDCDTDYGTRNCSCVCSASANEPAERPWWGQPCTKTSTPNTCGLTTTTTGTTGCNISDCSAPNPITPPDYPNCYGNIQGDVYYDANASGFQDTGEMYIIDTGFVCTNSKNVDQARISYVSGSNIYGQPPTNFGTVEPQQCTPPAYFDSGTVYTGNYIIQFDAPNLSWQITTPVIASVNVPRGGIGAPRPRFGTRLTPVPCNTSYPANQFYACYFEGTGAPLTPALALNQGNQPAGATPNPVGAWGGFDNNWGTTIEIDSSGKNELVSGVWRAAVNFLRGKYIFHVITNDGAILNFSGNDYFATPLGDIISSWTNKVTDTQVDSAQRYLPAGIKNVTMRWYENLGGARIRLWWDFDAPPVATPGVPTGGGISTPPDLTNLTGNTGAASFGEWPPGAATLPLRPSFTWSSNEAQTAFQIQIDDNSGFSSTEYDSGKIVSAVLSHPVPSIGSSTCVPGVSPLTCGITYYWRVRVWDPADIESNWATGQSFSTQTNRAPTISATWTPSSPAPQQLVNFTDTSITYGLTTKSAWAWTFQDGNPPSSTLQNPAIRFQTSGAKTITLIVTDSNNISNGNNSLNLATGGKLPGILKWIEYFGF